MRFVIQRVQHAEVKVDGEVTGSIGKGFLVPVSYTHLRDSDAGGIRTGDGISADPGT